MATVSKFVISLDFELLWGMRDHADKAAYGRNILGGRDAIARILDLFAKYGINATWATVGFVFCESKDELVDSLPAVFPSYTRRSVSNYNYFDDVGQDERSDPYYFGASLVETVSACPGQEIGSHSFSHYYCLEPGQTIEEFSADVDAAKAIAAKRGIMLKSFVFPRNQYALQHLHMLEKKGFKAFRGNEHSFVYEPRNASEETRFRRAIRLADSYINLTGHHARNAEGEGGLVSVSSSRFLRPFSRRLAMLEPRRLERVKSSMTAAAVHGLTFHLWWHPHNFGACREENISFLNLVLMHHRRLHEQYGMQSLSMGGIVEASASTSWG